jgi:hypothetical protein
MPSLLKCKLRLTAAKSLESPKSPPAAPAMRRIAYIAGGPQVLKAGAQSVDIGLFRAWDLIQQLLDFERIHHFEDP